MFAYEREFLLLLVLDLTEHQPEPGLDGDGGDVFPLRAQPQTLLADCREHFKLSRKVWIVLRIVK